MLGSYARRAPVAVSPVLPLGDWLRVHLRSVYASYSDRREIAKTAPSLVEPFSRTCHLRSLSTSLQHLAKVAVGALYSTWSEMRSLRLLSGILIWRACPASLV
jgi:hypothetical protein